MKSFSAADIQVQYEASRTTIVCTGDWTIHAISRVASDIGTIATKYPITWDIRGIDEIDSAGIALLQLSIRQFETAGFTSAIIGSNESQTRLYHLLYPNPLEEAAAPAPSPFLYRLGRSFHLNLQGIAAFLAFLGEAFFFFYHLVRRPSHIRYRSIFAHIYATGVSALPIIATSAFLIGVVIAYQSIVQLQKFGADIFIVDTIGISLTRELAPLITAIVVAGRSGSAFTAQIGAMKMTQEIDAMKTMGFNPFVFLVWPRVLALMIVMPLLIFFADMIGIFGGMIIAQIQSHLSFDEFLYRLKNALPLKHYLIGIFKGPFFAFLIAMVSTYRGFQVSLNTESIGLYTTRSVVNAIFLVIACDALFSILLTELKL